MFILITVRISTSSNRKKNFQHRATKPRVQNAGLLFDWKLQLLVRVYFKKISKGNVLYSFESIELPESPHQLVKRKSTPINVVNYYNDCFGRFYEAEYFVFNTSYFSLFCMGFIEIFLAPECS